MAAPEGLKPVETPSGPRIATAEELLKAAPKDIVEEVLTISEWDGLKVKVRSLTAARGAKVKQASIDLSGENPDVAWGDMEVTQFECGVVEPKLTRDQVKQLHRSSGAGFQRVIAWIDEHSGIDKEELRKAQREFRESEE